jgi:hypothetical protein
VNLEFKRKQLELANVQVARQTMELKIAERQDEIARLEAHIKVQLETEVRLTKELNQLKGDS